MTHANSTKTDSDPRALSLWLDWITHRLGRHPRGLRAIAAWNERGEPAVIRVASVVDGKPFPTLFWLIDADLCLRLDRLEAAGCIAQLQSQINSNHDLRQSMVRDHERHRTLRDTFLHDQERELLERKGMMAALTERGIGGITEPTRVRCLHTWFAAHLVQANTVGRLTEALLAASSAEAATPSNGAVAKT